MNRNFTLESGRILKAKNYLLPLPKARQIIIAGDNDQPDLLADKAKTADVLVHEATYTEEIAIKIGSSPQHSYAKKVAQFAEEIGLEHLILTHFSARYQINGSLGSSISDIENEARKAYSKNLFFGK